MYRAETCVRDCLKAGRSRNEIIRDMNALGIRFGRGREFDWFVWCPVSLAILCAKHGIELPSDGGPVDDSQLETVPAAAPPAFVMEARECANGCGRTFRCLSTSAQKVCSSTCGTRKTGPGGWCEQHAAKKELAVSKKTISHEELTAAPEEKLEVRVKKEGGGDGKALRALIAKYPDRKPTEIAELAKAKGLKKSDGKPDNSAYVSAVKSKLGGAASSEDARKSDASESARSGARRLPELAVAILCAEDLEDSERVQMLRAYAGVPI